jgi:hypothetical protein
MPIDNAAVSFRIDTENSSGKQSLFIDFEPGRQAQEGNDEIIPYDAFGVLCIVGDLNGKDVQFDFDLNAKEWQVFTDYVNAVNKKLNP